MPHGAVSPVSVRDQLVETRAEIETASRPAPTAQFNSTVTGSGLRFIRRGELRRMVPLADTTIYEMERRGEFPRRLYLTSRCVAWDLAEVETWMRERRRASCDGQIRLAPMPDVRRRKARPVLASGAAQNTKSLGTL